MHFGISTFAQRPSQGLVFLLDSEPCARKRGRCLIRSVGLNVQTFASAEDFLASQRSIMPSCVLVEVRLLGITGLALQRRLTEANDRIPIIFLTAHGDIPMAVSAMKAGAIDFLTKPCRDQDLLDAIHLGLEQDRVSREKEIQMASLWKRFELLTSREREIIKLVGGAELNKRIAAQIGISENTVKSHRSRAMLKLRAESLAALVRMSLKLKHVENEASSWRTTSFQKSVVVRTPGTPPQTSIPIL